MQFIDLASKSGCYILLGRIPSILYGRIRITANQSHYPPVPLQMQTHDAYQIKKNDRIKI
jgi:hypothetical protein